MIELRWHAEPLAVGLVAADADFAGKGPIHGSLTTGAGRTIVFPSADAGPDIRCEGPFRALEIKGPLDFSLTGILAGVLNPLAAAEISVFTLSTYDTDWILVPAADAEAASRVLSAAGYGVEEAV